MTDRTVKRWLAWCPNYTLAACCDTRGVAVYQAVMEAYPLSLQASLQNGELEARWRELRKEGWRVVRVVLKAPL